MKPVVNIESSGLRFDWGWRRYPRLPCICAFLCAALVSSLSLFPPPAPRQLTEDGNWPAAQFKALWNRGEIVVLVRHVERCDHSSAVCLNAADGITARAKNVAVHLGGHFKTLGLDNADIFASPLTRTAQTATFMFNSKVTKHDWLYRCKKHLLKDVAQHKQVRRNLILITHSECIEQLEQELHVPHNQVPGYGAALFLSYDTENGPTALGVVNASDWPEFLTRLNRDGPSATLVSKSISGGYRPATR